MPLRTVKQETTEKLVLEWALHVKDYKLTLDKNRCVGCQICSLACPKQAITTAKPAKTEGQKTRRAKIDIDLAKCNFCGICDAACIYGAINLTIDGKRSLPIIEKQSFPPLRRDIQINPDKFPKDTKQTEDACPLALIKIAQSTSTGNQIEKNKIEVTIDKDHCPCCTICQTKLPEGAINVHRIITGKLTINQSKCPTDCTDCLDTCPITGALYLSKQDNKVYANETLCVYCGTCKLACPRDEALTLKRTGINHTPIRSGAWNQALERLTSPTDLTKELKTKISEKAMEAVRKRTTLEEKQTA